MRRSIFSVCLLFLTAATASLAAEQPEIYKVVPNPVRQMHETRVLVFGSGFSAEGTTVTMGGLLANHQVLSDSVLVVDTPLLQEGLPHLVVNGANGASQKDVDVRPPDKISPYDYLNAMFEAVFWGTPTRMITPQGTYVTLAQRLNRIREKVVWGEGDAAARELNALVHFINAAPSEHIAPRLKEVLLVASSGLAAVLPTIQPNPLRPYFIKIDGFKGGMLPFFPVWRVMAMFHLYNPPPQTTWQVTFCTVFFGPQGIAPIAWQAFGPFPLPGPMGWWAPGGGVAIPPGPWFALTSAVITISHPTFGTKTVIALMPWIRIV